MTTVDFLPFANDLYAANVVTQADYLTAASGSGYVQNGFPSGRADSNKANKALRQSSVMVAAIAQWLAAKTGTDVLDSGGSAAITTLAAQIVAAVQAAPTADLPMGGHKHTGVANAVSTNQYVALGQANGLYQPLDSDLTAIAALTASLNNIIVGNGSAWVAQSGSTARTSLGVAIGTNVQAWDADLDALAALASTGISTRTAANTWAQRTIAATSGHATITNGDGVAGNPTLSIPALMRQAVTASSSSLNIDMALGWTVALALNATVTSFTVSNWPASGVLGKLTLEVTNGGSYNITGYPGTTKYWTDGAVPTMTVSGRDTVILTSGDGGTVFRNYQASQNMS